MEKNAKEILRENVLQLLQQDKKFAGKETGVKRLQQLGILGGNAQRVLDLTDVPLSRIDQLAEAFDIEPWQLLVPKLNPAAPPALTGDTKPWPFPMVEETRYLALSPEGRAYVQSKLDSAIEQQEQRATETANRFGNGK